MATQLQRHHCCQAHLQGGVQPREDQGACPVACLCGTVHVVLTACCACRCMKRFVLSWPFAVIVNIAILGTVVTALLWNVVNRVRCHTLSLSLNVPCHCILTMLHTHLLQLAFDACVNANGATHCWGTYMGKVYLVSIWVE